jgi:hypothetical protein
MGMVTAITLFWSNKPNQPYRVGAVKLLYRYCRADPACCLLYRPYPPEPPGGVTYRFPLYKYRRRWH